MKIALIALVILSIVFLFGLVFMSFKLLRKAQKEELQQRREMRKTGDYKIHPQLAEEWKRLEKMKKNLKDKDNQ